MISVMLRTFAFAGAAGLALGLPVVVVLNVLDPAAWITQTAYFLVIAIAGLATAHYDAQQRRDNRRSQRVA